MMLLWYILISVATLSLSLAVLSRKIFTPIATFLLLGIFAFASTGVATINNPTQVTASEESVMEITSFELIEGDKHNPDGFFRYSYTDGDSTYYDTVPVASTAVRKGDSMTLTKEMRYWVNKDLSPITFPAGYGYVITSPE
jgi:hypothetical protein